MSSDETTTSGALPPGEDSAEDNIDRFARQIVEDAFYNVIHGIVLKTHREEKIARANSAAIIVSQKAEEIDSLSSSESTSKRPTKVSTSSAVYDDSAITLIGNPLQTLPAQELRCTKCGRPRLLHPTYGNSSQAPDSKIEYCTRHPFIDKPGHDIYGQSFPIDATGPGKGKKKSLAAKIGGFGVADSTDTGLDSPAPSPPSSSQQPGLPNTFPNVKCPRCARPLAIKRFAAHFNKCISGRSSTGRTAQLKLNHNSSSNTPNSSFGNVPTPPGSRKGTPIPVKKNSSSQKRDRDFDDYEDEDSDEASKKKKRKLLTFKKKEGGGGGGIPLGKPTNGITKKWKIGQPVVEGGKIKLKLTNNSRFTSNTPNTASNAEAGEGGGGGELRQKPPIKPEKAESVSSQTTTMSSP